MVEVLDPSHSQSAPKANIRRRRGRACITCKIRRVRCDYGQPSCNRCLSTGRKCDGYPSPQGGRQDPPPIGVLLVLGAPMPALCEHEAWTSLRFFVQVCAPAMLNYGSHRFWNELVLQACGIDQSIKHLTIAASRLGSHRLRQPCKPPFEQDVVFLEHYGRALKLLSQTQNPDPGFLLMACLLLVLCDEYRENSFAAIQHLIAGRKILNTYRSAAASSSTQRTGDNTAITELEQIFSMLELHTSELHQIARPQAMTWWSPHCKTEAAAVAENIVLYPQVDPTQLWGRIDAATRALQDLAFECTALRLDGPPPQTRFQVVPDMTDKLNAWLAQLTALEFDPSATHHHHLSTEMLADLHLLRTYHLCLHVLSRCGPFRQEVAFDAYAGTIEHVVVSCGLLIRRPRRARLVPILFFVATRYRNASFRRRAICMLRQCGLDGQMLARIAVRVVRIEENGLASLIVGSDVPEQHRIRLRDIVFDRAGIGAYLLRFTRHPYYATCNVDNKDSPADTVPLEHTALASQACVWTTPPPTSAHATTLLEAALRFDFMAFWNQEDPESAA
ncbi:hypothetical protein AYO21_00982 [Fonsecaea monophora]|uniref:Zn(2)-C6 fungal-type domain-containing protein n=1 Tax=Fonsecaea monophora TaxID=254056 RepID=A0A177FN72_9EURO|nr:hypothetical protein AYO21_00982 [Fonsecaea monophora]KAH0844514.1 hypothetical protein FOPE_09471 [Fonsecaea pedrosoi]OAG45020.1 hypothetical protein AYO21_00982 [Fonsecaea monophora]